MPKICYEKNVGLHAISCYLLQLTSRLWAEFLIASVKTLLIDEGVVTDGRCYHGNVSQHTRNDNAQLRIHAGQTTCKVKKTCTSTWPKNGGQCKIKPLFPWSNKSGRPYNLYGFLPWFARIANDACMTWYDIMMGGDEGGAGGGWGGGRAGIWGVRERRKGWGVRMKGRGIRRCSIQY